MKSDNQQQDPHNLEQLRKNWQKDKWQEIPSGYFDQLSDQILGRLETSPELTSDFPVSKKNKSQWILAAATAVIILLCLLLIPRHETLAPSPMAIEEVDFTEEYLTYHWDYIDEELYLLSNGVEEVSRYEEELMLEIFEQEIINHLK